LFLRLNFVFALAGMFGSLYFSEVMQFPPCSLCWYQRICLYPLVVIFGAALLTNDHRHQKYSFPLLFGGIALSVYHNLLYYGVIPQEIIPCTGGVSCSTRQLELFGFITIPLMSLGAFMLMSCLAFFEWKSPRRS
jgi:disulfide bond formation protein DsbB